MDNALLEKLLSEHNRLIIPNFGAFLRKEGQSSIVFSPFLKKDDGLLTQILKSEYGVENFDAESMTSEWVAHVRESLNSKGKYHIEGIGLLVMDANGAIAMVAEPAPTPQKPPIPSFESHHGQPTIVHPPVQTAPATNKITEPSIAQPAAAAQPTFARPTASAAPAMPTPTATIAPAAPIAPVAEYAQPQAPSITAPSAQQRIQPTAQTAIPQTPLQQPSNIPPQPIVRPAMPSIPQPQPRMAAPAPRPIGAPNSAKAPNEQPWERPNQAGNIPNPKPVQQGAPRPNAAPMPTDGKPRPNSNPQQRPAQRPQQSGGAKRRSGAPNKQKQKVETLLIVAIIAAIVIVALIIYGLLTVNPTTEFYQPPM